jgi:hypothetical protein
MGEAGAASRLGALLERVPADTVALREVIASRLVEAERWVV